MAEIDEQIKSAQHVLGQIRHHRGSVQMIGEFCADSVIWGATKGFSDVINQSKEAQEQADKALPVIENAISIIEELVSKLQQLQGIGKGI